MSSGFKLSPILTSEVTDCAPSLIEEAAICECSSIIPAVTCLPVPSITRAPASDRFLPTLAILPSLINTSVFNSFPSFSLVQTVAFFINKFSAVGCTSQPYPSNGKVTFAKRCGSDDLFLLESVETTASVES